MPCQQEQVHGNGRRTRASAGDWTSSAMRGLSSRLRRWRADVKTDPARSLGKLVVYVTTSSASTRNGVARWIAPALRSRHIELDARQVGTLDIDDRQPIEHRLHVCGIDGRPPLSGAAHLGVRWPRRDQPVASRGGPGQIACQDRRLGLLHELQGRRGVDVPDHRSPRRSSRMLREDSPTARVTTVKSTDDVRGGRVRPDSSSRSGSDRPGGDRTATGTPRFVTSRASPPATRASTALLLLRSSRWVMDSTETSMTSQRMLASCSRPSM